MPLQQLCSSNKRAGSSNCTYISPALHAQGVYDADLTQRSMERCGSQTSTLSFSKDICRICHCEGDHDTVLIVPCYCSGSLRYVHQSCLQQWIKSSGTKCCELCKYPFIMHSKVKPFQQWERLYIDGMEQRKITFSVFFHMIAIFCVVWSLFVLIARTYEEVKNGELEWPFWTKLIVVAIGFAGGIVFTFLQCKLYVQLCRRWRAYNRVICVQNAPEKIRLHGMEASKMDPELQNDGDKKAHGPLSVIEVHGATPPLRSTELITPYSAELGGGGCTPPEVPHCRYYDESSLQFFSLNELSRQERKPLETDSLLTRNNDKEHIISGKKFWLSSQNKTPILSPSKSAPSLSDFPSTASSVDIPQSTNL